MGGGEEYVTKNPNRSHCTPPFSLLPVFWPGEKLTEENDTVANTQNLLEERHISLDLGNERNC